MPESDMKHLHLPLLLTLGLTLAACAPTVRGADTYAPLLATSAFSPAEVAVGKTTYVRYAYPQGYVGVSDERFDALTIDFDKRNVTGDVSSSSIDAPWLKMNVKDAPNGWTVELARAELAKDIVRTTEKSASINVSYYDRVRVTYRITAAPGARSGIAHLQFLDNGAPLEDVSLMLMAK